MYATPSQGPSALLPDPRPRPAVEDLELAFRATLNILEDASAEKTQLEQTLHAFMNILDDFEDEKTRLESTQRASLNILEDFDLEKTKAELAYREMQRLVTEREQAGQQVKELNQRLELRATELESANNELEAFSQSVSHDLRAPLRAIDGFSRLLLKDCADRLTGDGVEYLNRIIAATKRMADLIDALLQLARLSRAPIRWQEVDLSRMADEVMSELRRAEPHRHVDSTAAPGLRTSGDPTLLRVALTNLLSNAWKFTSATAAPHVEFGSSVREGRTEYFVRDNGAGFEMEYAGSLFQPFKRLHDATEYPGTGIGLATVAWVVRRHGGTVRAEGKVSEGATFYFTL